ncbi:MAG: SCO family protein [Methylophilus sp.]|nr:SCO family protein [Methylophilus sp.]
MQFKLGTLLLSVCLTFALQTSVRAVEDTTSFYTHFQNKAFLDQNGQLLKTTSLKGKVILFNFIYTQCSTVCPVQTKQLIEIQKSFPAEVKQQVQFVSVSLDPLNDTPKKLKAYAKKMQVDFSSWTLITGKPEDIQHITEQLSLFGNPAANQNKTVVRPNNHTTQLWLVSKNGQLMMQYGGISIDMARISKEVTQLTKM